MSEFLQGMFGARPVEWIAVACGLINVALIIRRSVWNFPFGFAMVTLYFFIFRDYRLYSDAALQTISSPSRFTASGTGCKIRAEMAGSWSNPCPAPASPAIWR